MKHYELTFIVDPVLSGDEIKKTAKAYTDFLKNEGCGITFENEMGLQQLAYPINKRQSGVYFCTEFTTETGEIIAKIELAMKRDERVMRFLSVGLNKYGVKYNEDKRNGLIGTVKKAKKEDESDKKDDRRSKSGARKTAPAKSAPAAAKAAPAAVEATETKAAAPVAEKAAVASTPDDLTKIEGIGPKIASLLIGAGINSFSALAGADVDKIKSILADAGSRYTMHNPATWPTQSQLAADGKWDELKVLQDELDGGVPAGKNEEE